nr:immunoglobulin heavy chain junction region [Macaca mulatta]MOW98204.1 immunoglobulin heavy chain junction region [Macaca mulatta]MOW98246.1 immunoglobulin heavy chain junction region [Macaca mulatta]MOW98271.1 immunoglobulin heavy chain junction region [Macaca mulatta]MOW98395.1 immunoglobulin heavy chain junction region [Macaca mulatta]
CTRMSSTGWGDYFRYW